MKDAKIFLVVTRTLLSGARQGGIALDRAAVAVAGDVAKDRWQTIAAISVVMLDRQDHIVTQDKRVWAVPLLATAGCGIGVGGRNGIHQRTAARDLNIRRLGQARKTSHQSQP